MFETGGRQLADFATPLEVLGIDRGDVAYECLDCSKPMVASAWAALALFFQPAEERTDHLYIESCGVKLVSGASSPSRGMLEEELEGVAVGQDCVAAGVAFDNQVLLEEVLDERLKGGCGGARRLH
jgi:hypothetical protein